ncbi:hypothetical protein FrCorBMG51_16015 [Protofrankia coriariae]|uniref:Uncharacterized protein n=1 Tax=Protofrankia coriariae TaxID=1562887 RepID=A0ABR5F1X8_9ACTN|nr:hypothetical protein FrCorBMG51_16015 [Protofrankia coriariae]
MTESQERDSQLSFRGYGRRGAPPDVISRHRCGAPIHRSEVAAHTDDILARTADREYGPVLSAVQTTASLGAQ